MALVDRLATSAALEEPALPFEGTWLIGHVVLEGLFLYLKKTIFVPKGSQLRKNITSLLTTSLNRR